MATENPETLTVQVRVVYIIIFAVFVGKTENLKVTSN